MPVRPLTIDDVEVFRAVRLRALATNPEAFAATHAAAADYDDDTWRSRLAGFAGRPGQIFVHHPPPVGLLPHGPDDDSREIDGVVGIGESSEPSDCVLWGMWVDPDRRGSGIGRALIDAAVGWARERGAATVTLWVMRTNGAARGLYERYGFSEHPYEGPDAADSCADEPCFRLRLDAPGGEHGSTAGYAASP